MKAEDEESGGIKKAGDFGPDFSRSPAKGNNRVSGKNDGKDVFSLFFCFLLLKQDNQIGIRESPAECEHPKIIFPPRFYQENGKSNREHA